MLVSVGALVTILVTNRSPSVRLRHRFKSPVTLCPEPLRTTDGLSFGSWSLPSDNQAWQHKHKSG